MKIKAETKETMEVEYELTICEKSMDYFKSMIYWLSCEMSNIAYGFSEKLKQEKLDLLQEKLSYFEAELERAKKRYVKFMIKYDKLVGEANGSQEPEK